MYFNLQPLQTKNRKNSNNRESFTLQVDGPITGRAYIEGPEGVKWELGFAYFCTGKMRFGSLGLGITKTNWEWETCIEIS